MANPIVETTRAILSELPADVLAPAELATHDWTLEHLGESMTLEESIRMEKGCKFLAASDGLSLYEGDRQVELLEARGFPIPLLEHLLEFDLSGVTREHVSELFPAGSRRARYLIAGALAIATADELTPHELDVAVRLGEGLGVEPEMVKAFAAVERIAAQLERQPDPRVTEQLIALRKCLFRMR